MYLYPVRDELLSVVNKADQSAFRAYLYLLSVTRERTLRFTEQYPEQHVVTEFARTLLHRDRFYLQWLTAEQQSWETTDLLTSMLQLQDALLRRSAPSDSPLQHWLTQENPVHLHQIIFEMTEEESAKRGELSATLPERLQ